MKRILLLLACILLLCGCSREEAPTGDLLVSIVEESGFQVLDNGQRGKPGEDVTFHLRLDSGISITDTSYSGEVSLETSGRDVVLTVHSICFPTQIRLNLSSRSCTIFYDANGGVATSIHGTRYSKTYDLSYHRRPNTEPGTNRFTRDGYTLAAWNTQPDGSGTHVGLGSRITPATGEEMTLYAQWLPWTDSSAFSYVQAEGGIRITGCTCQDTQIVIPQYLDGLPVVSLACGAFSNLPVTSLVLPTTLEEVEPEAIRNCALEELILFDNIQSIADASVSGCSNFSTLRINAVESPYGYLFRRESCYADKIDLLILAQGKKKFVCYGGCSMWFNLDSATALRELGEEYTLINLAISGTVNSLVQLQILTPYLETGDFFFHTPELSSQTQLLLETGMTSEDQHLWCGLENNYDLFTAVDLRTISGALDSFCLYLDTKSGQTNYAQRYTDDLQREYMDKWGCVPIFRAKTAVDLSKTDPVFLSKNFLSSQAMDRLNGCYQAIRAQGATVCLSYACVNLDALPQGQEQNVSQMDILFHQAIEAMDGVTLVSTLEDYLYQNDDFYDTNYHLLSAQAQENTRRWFRDLRAAQEGGLS